MNNYSVYTTESFDREMKKLNNDEQERIMKIFLQLKSDPHTGKQLKYKHLREKRMDEKRIYYLVYDNFQAVLIVALGGKKTQQETIDHIIQYFQEYRVYLERILNDED